MFWLIPLAIIVVLFLAGVRIVRPTTRGLIERLGKYTRFATPGFNWVFPGIERMVFVNVTEQMVDAQVYFKVKDDEPSVMASQYNVNDYTRQIVNLARTTLRNIIGTMTLKSANSERGKINQQLLETVERLLRTTPRS